MFSEINYGKYNQNEENHSKSINLKPRKNKVKLK